MSIVCKLFFIHYFFTLPLQYTVHRKSTAQLVQYYFLTDIGDQSTLSANDSWMLCVLIVFVSPAFFFPLKNQPQYLIDFQVEKVLCCVLILLSVTRLSYQWRLNKNAFFLSISCQVYAKTACAEFGGARMFKTTQNSVEDLFYHKLK